VEQYINKGISVKKQQTPPQIRGYLLASYLALATGRRNVEILKTLKITKKKNDYFYEGLLKKGSASTENTNIKAVSLDDDFEFLMQIINQLRTDTDTSKMTNQEVNSKYSAIFNRSFKHITNTQYTFHDAREIYSEIAYNKFGRKNGGEREEIDYKSDILGHQIDKERLISTEHYTTKKGKWTGYH